MSVIRSTHFGRLSMLANETNRLSSRMTEASKVAASGLSYSKASDAPNYPTRNARQCLASYQSVVEYAPERIE